MDISPKTKDGIVDINIHEESHVEEILRELIQRFGDKEDSESLKKYLIYRLEKKVRNHEVLFYEFDYNTNKQHDVSVEYGLDKLHGKEVWLNEDQPKLHIYGANT